MAKRSKELILKFLWQNLSSIKRKQFAAADGGWIFYFIIYWLLFFSVRSVVEQAICILIEDLICIMVAWTWALVLMEVTQVG